MSSCNLDFTSHRITLNFGKSSGILTYIVTDTMRPEVLWPLYAVIIMKVCLFQKIGSQNLRLYQLASMCLVYFCIRRQYVCLSVHTRDCLFVYTLKAINN